ncbi:hypothetical protein CBS101457_005705 [Exobasidium rhododendri]|nr:hypothetical protein CBS101457_005705 [Exobasidium rhododendri]
MSALARPVAQYESTTLTTTTFLQDYVRCNQDLLGSRNTVKSLATRSLHAGLNVVIDRTNVDEMQRATWVDLAHSLPNIEVQAIVFQTPLDVCKARLAIRSDHETIRDPAHALDVIERFHRDLTIPQHSEGFQRILSVTPADFALAIPTKQEIDVVLAHMEATPVVNVPLVRSAAVRDQIAQRGRRGARGGRWQSNAAVGRGSPHSSGISRAEGSAGVGPNVEGRRGGGNGGGGGYWQQRAPNAFRQQQQTPASHPSATQ